MRTDAPPTAARVRRQIRITGCVQGVGFRPFVFRLARELALAGWVQNSSQGVQLEIEGDAANIERFEALLKSGAPRHAQIFTHESSAIFAQGEKEFAIRESALGESVGTVLPDLATCSDCLTEIRQPGNRRYHYPFTNCTNCGPRFSILERAPYDRSNTSMKHFALCPSCAAEYADPANRRFHAQPNACPDCGPQLQLWDDKGRTVAHRSEALAGAVDAIRSGRIVAIKGIGGFQLLVDARQQPAIARLRVRKHRDEKPFALMFPSLNAIRDECDVSAVEADMLSSAAAPIVILRRRSGSTLPDSIAPGHPTLGAMLPCSPLHHLLMDMLNAPVVATSGNRADEPICTDEREALQRLAGIADDFLVHDRPIARPVDDSIVHVVAGREQVLRRARGYAPLPIRLTHPLPQLTAFGAHLKSSIAISRGNDVILSQHLSDLETVEARTAFTETLRDLPKLFNHNTVALAADLHPDYASTRKAREFGAPIPVQHHYAHVLACMADNGISHPVLGVAWDGAGLGTDGTIWGGEFLEIHASGFERVAHLRPFLLPGGDASAREPRRSALSVLFELFGDAAFSMTELAPVRAFNSTERAHVKVMLKQKLNAPATSSVGRLCDAVAALLNLCQHSSFEGQAAIRLEDAIQSDDSDEFYSLPLRGSVIDWEPGLREILADIHRGIPAGLIAKKFHNALAEAIVCVAQARGKSAVALSGGCFQNKYLTERTVARLRASGFTPYWHHRVPPNDGGIALGQILAAARELER